MQAYRIWPREACEGNAVAQRRIPLPAVAIIPVPRSRVVRPQRGPGDVIADELISRDVAFAIHERDIAAFDLDLPLAPVRSRRGLDHLKAKYVLSGTYSVQSGRLQANVELSETRSGPVARQERLSLTVKALAKGDFSALDELVAAATGAIMSRELTRLRRQSMPTLESYSMLLGPAIALMHDLTLGRFLACAPTAGSADRAVAAREHGPRPGFGLVLHQRSTRFLRQPEAHGLRANELALKALDLDPESLARPLGVRADPYQFPDEIRRCRALP